MRAKEKVNVLMVDDQPAKLLTYEAILAPLKENLIRANSGAEALELLLKNDVAVVLTDVSMPGMDGFELADTIRQHPRFQQMAIIFISAVCVSDLDRLKGYQTGAVDYISVPIIPEVLRAKVSVFCELHRREQQLEALNRELRVLSNSLIAAQDSDRRRIARAMHDGLGQELAAAKMVLDGILTDHGTEPWKKQLATADASAMIERAIVQVRSISHLLHPPLLDEVGLASAISWFLEGFSKRCGITTSLEIEPLEFPRMHIDVETAVFRIVQEALNNVYRHSGARDCWVTLKHDRRLFVTVRDNGKGINAAVVASRPDSIGVGIGGMRQRVKEFGGELTLENCSPGTRIAASIPSASFTCQEVDTAHVLGQNLRGTAPAEPLSSSSTPLTVPSPASAGTSKPVSVPTPNSNDVPKSSSGVRIMA
jgi:signal transduction histidine kinase